MLTRTTPTKEPIVPSGRLEVSLTAYTYGAGVVIPSSQRPATVGYYTYQLLNQINITGTGAVFTFPNHMLVTGDRVEFDSLTGGSGLTVGVTYFVVAPVATNTFALSATNGGAAITLGSNLTGSVANTSNTTLTQTISMQPQRFGETWAIDRITVQNSSALLVPTATVYRGIVNPSAIVDVTQNGTNDVDDLNSTLYLSQGEPVIIQFTGSDPPPFGGVITSTVYLGGTQSR